METHLQVKFNKISKKRKIRKIYGAVAVTNAAMSSYFSGQFSIIDRD